MSVTEAEPARRHSGGRPSLAEARRRDERLLDVAATIFMERGFDATTIDAVAEAASVGKATVYARYKDKADLFAAICRRKIEGWLTVAADGDVDESSAAEGLLALARRMTKNALAPETVAISRMVMAQAARFPEIARLVHKEGWQKSTALVTEQLHRYAGNGEIQFDNAEVTADLFISLVIGRQTRLAMLGIEFTAEQLDQRLQAAVTLFLNGVRPRE